MVGLDDTLRLAAIAALLGGFGIAGYLDWRTREVSDVLWQAMSAVGAVLGLVLLVPDGLVATLLWLVVSAFVFEHLLPWDVPLERVSESLPALIEIVAYVAVGVLLAVVGLTMGLGATALPPEVLAVFLTVVFARGLFEAGLLYGGADAKAMIAAGILVPILSTAVVSLPSASQAILSIYPFSLTMLMNAALVAVGIPLAIGVRNVRRGEFSLPRGFTGYTIAVADLPDRFVWLKDPTFASSTEKLLEAETSEDDRKIRVRQKAELEAKGVVRVWVTPQIPFLVLFLIGAVLAIVAGNLLIDLLGLL